MADLKQDIYFYGGIDSDSMYELVSQGDYLSAVNVTNNSKFSENERGKVVPRKGNRHIVNPFYVATESMTVDDVLYKLPLIERKTIGSVHDNATNSINYFVYEIYGVEGVGFVRFYSIYQFDNNKKEVVSQIVRTNIKIFGIDEIIKFGNILNGNLFWVQQGYEPKSVNIERAINYTLNEANNTNVNTPCYVQMTMQDFNVYRRPPIVPINAQYSEDATIVTNSIRGKLFQFRYKYVYLDNTESVWSPISKMPLPAAEFLSNGTWNEAINYNFIKLEYDVNNFDIKEVHIAKREYDGATKVVGLFELIKKIKLSNSVGINNYDFYNDVSGIILSENEAANMLDYIPLSCNSMEVVTNPDKIIYGGDIDEPINKENIDVDVSVIVTREHISDITPDSDYAEQSVFFSPDNIRTCILPNAVIKSNSKVNLRYHYEGMWTALYFPNGFLATNIILTFNFTPHGTNTLQQVSIPINISGISLIAELKTSIVNAINDFMTTNYGASETLAFGTAALFEAEAIATGSFFNTAIPNHMWTYVDWAFCRNSIYPSQDLFRGYEYGGYDYTGLGRCVFIKTGKILSIANDNYAFSDIKIYCKSPLVPFDTSDQRKFIRRYGFNIGLAMTDVNQTTIDGYYNDDFSVSFSPHLTSVGNSVATFKKIEQSTQHLTQRGYFGFISNAIISDEQAADSSVLNIRYTLTPFGRYAVGIVYFDECLRPRNGVQDCGEISVVRNNIEYGKAMIYKLQLNIKHFAPNWAKYWMPVISKNRNQQSFFEIDISIDTAASLLQLTGDYIKIRVNDAIALWNSQYGNTSDELMQYVFVKNNRDRMILYNTLTDKYLDKEIVKQDDEGYIYVSRGSDFASEADVSRLINIYTPNKAKLLDRFFEVGEINDIAIGGRHKNNGKHTIQTIAGLDYLIDFGDIYLNVINNYVYLTSPTTAWQPTYNQFLRPFYPSRMNSYGRSHIINNKVETAIKDRIRMSSATPDNSVLKLWNRFEYNEKVDMGERYGSIVGLVQIGYTLKVITETKLISIYINRVSQVNPDGTEEIMMTNKTIGSIIVPEYDYGCKNPESIIKNDRNLYYINIDNGYVIRDSANGQVPISAYKHASYFNKLFQPLREDIDHKIKVFGAFNKDDAEYILIFNNMNSSLPLPLDNDYNAVVFNEDKNRWVSYITQFDSTLKQPEWVDFVANGMITFIDGQLSLENDDSSDRATYYGVQRIPNIKTVINIEAKKIKTYQAIAVHSTDKWDMHEDGDISILPSVTYPTGMSSRLKANKLVDKEGIFYSEFMGDGNTPSLNYVQGLLNGRSLRGNVMLLKLRNTVVNKDSKLFSLSIRIKLSEHSY